MTTDDETIIFEMDACSPSGERRTSRSRWDSMFSAIYRMDSLRARGWSFSPVRVYVGTMGTIEQAVQEKLR